MKHIIRKAYWNWEKEEKWLNELSAKGLALTDYSWCRYVLEDAKPGEYVYRIDLLDHFPSHPQSRKFIEFLEETGVEFVASYMRWVYFRKKAKDGAFTLYTDIASRIAHYKRIRMLWLPLGIAELAVGIPNIIIVVTRSFYALNLFGGLLCCLLGILFTLHSLQITRKIRALKKEQSIHEA